MSIHPLRRIESLPQLPSQQSLEANLEEALTVDCQENNVGNFCDHFERLGEEQRNNKEFIKNLFLTSIENDADGVFAALLECVSVTDETFDLLYQQMLRQNANQNGINWTLEFFTTLEDFKKISEELLIQSLENAILKENIFLFNLLIVSSRREELLAPLGFFLDQAISKDDLEKAQFLLENDVSSPGYIYSCEILKEFSDRAIMNDKPAILALLLKHPNANGIDREALQGTLNMFKDELETETYKKMRRLIGLVKEPFSKQKTDEYKRRGSLERRTAKQPQKKEKGPVDPIKLGDPSSSQGDKFKKKTLVVLTNDLRRYVLEKEFLKQLALCSRKKLFFFICTSDDSTKLESFHKKGYLISLDTKTIEEGFSEAIKNDSVEVFYKLLEVLPRYDFDHFSVEILKSKPEPRKILNQYISQMF